MAYRVEYAEPAEQDIDSAYLWLSRTRSPAFAARWFKGLRAAVERLTLFPRRNAVVEEYGTGVRRLLYGTSGSRYRVLYLVVEPEAEDEEGIVRILHVYHGARQMGGAAAPETDDE